MERQQITHDEDIVLSEAYDAIDDCYNRYSGTDLTGGAIDVLGRDFKNGLERIHAFVDRVRSSDRPAFEFVQHRGRPSVKRTRLSNIPSGRLVTQEFREHYELGEQLRAFLDAEDELSTAGEHPWHEPLRMCRNHPGMLVGQLANLFVELIRQKCKTKQFRQRLAQRRFAAKENYQAGKALIDALFVKWSRMNVLRIDFEYRIGKCPSFEKAQLQFSRFLNNRRHKSTFKSVLGYIWRLERGFLTGFHWHVIFFTDGSDTLRDGIVAQQFATYWNRNITRGRGRTHNCNYDKRRYKQLGIGMIHRDDAVKRDVLVDKVLAYLTKMEELVKPRVPKGTKTFQPSRLPGPHSGRGRKPKPRPLAG